MKETAKKIKIEKIFSKALLLTMAIIFLVVAARPGHGAVLFYESFDGQSSAGGTVYGGRFVSGYEGEGWQSSLSVNTLEEREFIEYIIDGGSFDPTGTVEFHLKRDVTRLDPDIRQESIIEFIDADYKSLLNIQILWDDFFSKDGKTSLLVYGGFIEELGVDPWGGEIFSLGKDVSAGAWLHVALSWGPNKSDRNIYINGNALKDISSIGGKNWKAKNVTIGSILARTAYIRVGSEAGHSVAWKDWTFSPLSNSVVDELRIHDLAFNPYKEPYEETVVAAAPEITSVEHDAGMVAGFSGKLVADDVVNVRVEGTSGVEASFDVARLADDDGNIELDWSGWGVYLDEDKVFFDGDEVDLEDVKEYSVYVSLDPYAEIAEWMVPVETLEVEEQKFTVEGLYADVPYYVYVVALMGDGSLKPVIWPEIGLPLAEDPEVQVGLYTGQFTVTYEDRYPSAVVIGRLTNEAGEATLAAVDYLELDASLNVDVQVSEELLPADEESKSKITVTVTDANGDAVRDHEIKFLLATTSQYTGVIGGGKFTDEVGGSLDVDLKSETDLFGQVKATYVAGFAAKTAIIVARDMVTNDRGSGFVKTYIQATAELELESVQETAGKALGYAITVTSSDEWLTADGDSRARITAQVTLDGQPVEGHSVTFSVTSGSGSIRAVSDVTDANGKARAVYTAGKRIGVVLVTATDTTVGINGSVQIELRSDAPAKINIEVDPETLPADGHSTAEITALVTDINDNPNEGVAVEYTITIGSGRLRDIDEVTDEDGYSKAEYVAGRIPGKVTVQVTVRSTDPTEEELDAAEALVVAVTDYDFF